jgi:hypothetical protein
MYRQYNDKQGFPARIGGREEDRRGEMKKEESKTPGKPGAGKSVILLAAIFVTYAGEEVEHFAQTVNQTQDDRHHHRYHDYGKNQTFQ